MKKLPKWFSGEHYKEGEIVSNRFSGEKIELNANELSMYDFIMGAQLMLEMGMFKDDELEFGWSMKDVKKGMDWFKENNSKAYMVLLD